jgi:hypothetical protein
MDNPKRLELIESDMAFKVAGLGLKVYLTAIHKPCRVIPLAEVHQLRDFLNANYPAQAGTRSEGLGITLQKTCSACPEQYDAYLGTRQVGYLRLRHGYFRVDFPKCGGETLLGMPTKGDGIFEDDEREACLDLAIQAIARRLASAGLQGGS